MLYTAHGIRPASAFVTGSVADCGFDWRFKRVNQTDGGRRRFIAEGFRVDVHVAAACEGYAGTLQRQRLRRRRLLNERRDQGKPNIFYIVRKFYIRLEMRIFVDSVSRPLQPVSPPLIQMFAVAFYITAIGFICQGVEQFSLAKNAWSPARLRLQQKCPLPATSRKPKITGDDHEREWIW